MKKKNNKQRNKKFFYAGILMILIGAIIIFASFNCLKNDEHAKEPRKATYLEYEVFKDITIKTDDFVSGQEEEQGFNSMIMNNAATNEDTEIINTTANLKLNHSEDVEKSFIELNSSEKMFAVYEYTTNKSEELSEEDRVRNYHAEILIINEKGEVESLGVSDKIFVDLYKNDNGDIILKEKLFLEGYTHIPSWDRPHVLYTSVLKDDGFEIIDSEEIYKF